MEPIRFDAAVLRAALTPLSIERVEARALGPDDVLVRMRAAGLCHTDLEVIEGQLVFPLPMVLGHEGAGVVERVGTAVRGLAPGDHVIIHWNPHCGHCFYCDRDQPILCETYVANGAKAVGFDGAPVLRAQDGATLHNLMYIGAFGEYCVVPAQSAVRVAKEIPFEAACLIGCGVMTGLGAALYAAGVKPGSSAAVFGCGGVGDSVIQGARLGGATTIIAVDIDPKKLEWAKQFGATHTVNPKEVDAVAKIKEITGGNGVNYSFEAVGKAQTLEQALWSRDLAGTCVFIGVPGPGPTLNLPLQKFFDLGGHLCVSWYGDCLPSRDFPLLADWYRQGQLKLDEVVTRTVSLDEVEEAFAAMERGETLRSVIVF